MEGQSFGIIIINAIRNYFTATIIKFLIAVLMFYLFDFGVGFTNAWKSRNIKSARLRDGVAKAIQYAIFIGIGITLDFVFNKNKIAPLFCIILCSIEFKSLLENFEKLGINVPEYIKTIFTKEGENK